MQISNRPTTEIPVVIVTRNGLNLTKRALASVFAQDIPVEVLVVDNDSQDGSRQYLATKSITTIMTDGQWSLAKCWNTALRALWKAGHTRALVMNNDLVLRPDLIRLLDSHGGPFVTGISVDEDDQFGEPGDRTLETLMETEREHPDYGCWLIRKSVTDQGCWFNEDCFPCYGEDSFHHKAMHDAGIRAVCLSIPFMHYGASWTLKQADPGEAARIRRGADRNRQLFKKAYGCFPNETKAYEALFTPETFGCKKRKAA